MTVKHVPDKDTPPLVNTLGGDQLPKLTPQLQNEVPQSPITFNPNNPENIITGAHVRVGMLAPLQGPAVFNSSVGRKGSN